MERDNELVDCGCGTCGKKIWKYDKRGRVKNMIKGHHNRGKKFSEEHIEKLRLANIGKKLSEEHKKKISEGIKGEKNPMYGKHHTNEVKQFISKLNTGRKHTEEEIQKFTESRKGKYVGDKHHAWKGNKAGKAALHEWAIRRIPKPKVCEICELVPPEELSNKSQRYLRKKIDWWWLCKKCHNYYDDIPIRNLNQYTNKTKVDRDSKTGKFVKKKLGGY